LPGHGAYHWDQNSTVLTVKLTGGRSLEARTENAILVSQTLATTVDQFYDSQAGFLRVRGPGQRAWAHPGLATRGRCTQVTQLLRWL
jgi:hypothetical protein